MMGQEMIGREFCDLMIPFQDQAREHPHGWGFGWFEEGRPRSLREACSAFQNPRFMEAARRVRSRIVIVHIRRTVPDSIALTNTHPFTYKQWIFCHEGIVDIKNELRDRLPVRERKELERSIDSEIFFHWVVKNIEEQGEEIAGVAAAVQYVRKNKGERTSSLNFLLSDGRSLFAFREAFKKEEYYTLHWREGPGSVAISSDPLSDEMWNMIPNHHLLVVAEDLGTRLSPIR